MAALSDYAREKIAEGLLGGVAISLPATWYLAATTVAITAAMTGTTITEPSGNGYTRKSVTNNQTNFGQYAADSVLNDVAIEFAQATGSWGTIEGIGFIDAVSDGNLWMYDNSISQAITSPNILRYAVGSIDLDMSAA